MKKTLFACLMALVVAPGAWAVTVDGTISTGEYPGLNTFTDSSTDNQHWPTSTNGTELVGFNLYANSGNLYVAMTTADPGPQYYYYDAGNIKSKLFPGAWIDVDRSDATLCGGETHQGYWPGPLGNAGIDINFEWGMANQQYYPGFSEFYFWGAGDNMDNTGTAWDTLSGTNHAHSTTANTLEFTYPISSIKTEVSGYPDGAVPKKVWKIGFAVQGTLRNDAIYHIDYGYDYAEPKYIPVETVWGDANEDTTCNLQDLSILASNYGSTGLTGDTWALADFNADGVVNLQDLSILASNYGQTYSGAEVPEPVSLILLGLGAVGLIRRK